jgi:hypothetical protein
VHDSAKDGRGLSMGTAEPGFHEEQGTGTRAA